MIKDEMDNNDLAVFQAENGALELRWNGAKDTVWANLD